MTDLTDRPHALYRFFDRDDDLLYIGITADPGSRWKAHAAGKPWWIDVATVRLETFPDRASVLEAERAAIRSEAPRYNVQHVGTTRTPAMSTIKAQEVVALGLRDGRCPVGQIDSWGDGWIELALMSWLSGDFGHEVRRYPERDVAEVVYARAMSKEEKQAAGESVHVVVWSMDALARFQTEWEHAHGRRTDDELALTLDTFTAP